MSVQASGADRVFTEAEIREAAELVGRYAAWLLGLDFEEFEVTPIANSETDFAGCLIELRDLEPYEFLGDFGSSGVDVVADLENPLVKGLG